MKNDDRLQEQQLYSNAKQWLEENGVFEVFPFKESSKFKAVFTKESNVTELIGEDLIRITIQIYNEVYDNK